MLRNLAKDLADCLEREYFFAQPEREYRADFAHVASRLLIEVDGGRWAPGGGRHMSDQDFWKLIEAAKRGWRVIRVSPAMLRNEPEQVIAAIRAAISVGL